jgi:hypothetical protein
MKLRKPSILVVNKFHPVFPFSWAPPLLLHIYKFTAPKCTTTIIDNPPLQKERESYNMFVLSIIRCLIKPWASLLVLLHPCFLLCPFHEDLLYSVFVLFGSIPCQFHHIGLWVQYQCQVGI